MAPAAPAVYCAKMGEGIESKDRDLIIVNVQIWDAAPNQEQSKVMLDWLHEHAVESVESVPVLDSVPILSRLFKRPMVIVLSADELAHFSEAILQPMNPTVLSRPSLVTRSGSTGTVEVGCYSPEEKELADGYRLSITPKILEDRKVRVFFELTRTRIDDESQDRNFVRDSNSSAVDLPKSRMKNDGGNSR